MNMSTSNDENIKWYHGILSRQQAEEILLNDPRKSNGLFLVRDSNTSAGDFVLSVVYRDQVNHFQIRRHGEDAFFSIDQYLKFHGVEKLIEHFLTNEGLSNDLVLRDYVKGSPPPADCRRFGKTNILHRAISEGAYRVVSNIIESTYRLGDKNHNGQTAVHLASMKGNNSILNQLINHGANVNLRDTFGLTPLHYACQNNLPTTVRLLVQVGGANIQARKTENGAVPLHDAASCGHKDVILELLSLNAPANPRTQDNEVPSQLARKHGHIQCAEILEDYTAPTSKTDKTQWYHGTLEREEAIAVIKQHGGKSGSFLIRFSRRNKENALTLLYEDIFYNYIIRKNDHYLFIDNGPYLNSLEHIVDYYSSICDGLPTVLLYPVPPQPKPPVPEISTLSTLKKQKNKLKLPIPTTNQINSDSNLLASQLPFQNISFKSDFNLSMNNDNSSIETEEECIPRHRLKLRHCIGEGEFASVYEGTYLKETGEELKVAIKTLRHEQITTKNRDAFLREAQVMIKLNHHCIVKLIGLAFGDPPEPPLLMVQDLIPLGSMLQYIMNYSKNNVNANYEFKIWAAQIAAGMQYLEKNNVVHRDLAARNILLASRNQAKISDFGLSRALGTDKEYYRAKEGGVWPLKWYAPESFNFGHFSHKSDVWSFGVTIWEMYSFGEPPYGDMKGAEAISLIERGERLGKPEECPEYIYEKMRACWEYDSDKRPDFTELVDFFSSDTEYQNIRELLPESDLA